MKIKVLEIRHYQLKNILIKLGHIQERVIHSKSDNIEIIINDEADEILKDLFDSLKNNYQNNLESVKGTDFVLNLFICCNCKCHKINLNCGGSYIDFPDWRKNKKAAINPINEKDNKCFPYVITVTLNHEEIGKHCENKKT